MLWPKRESLVTVNHCRASDLVWSEPRKSWSTRKTSSVGQQLPNGLNHCHNLVASMTFVTTGRHCLVLLCLALPCLSFSLFIHPWSLRVGISTTQTFFPLHTFPPPLLFPSVPLLHFWSSAPLPNLLAVLGRAPSPNSCNHTRNAIHHLPSWFLPLPLALSPTNTPFPYTLGRAHPQSSCR